MNYLKNKIKLLPGFRFFLITIAVFLLSACNKSESGVRDFEARFISNIDNKPVFSWSVTGKNNKLNQAGFRIIIAENKEGLENESGKKWDTGEVKESGQLQLKYQGNDLETGETYFAKIGVWSDGGHPVWSKPIRFTVPIKYPEDWNAKWITYDYYPDSALPVFKTIIEPINLKKIESVKLYIAAPGFYEAFLNEEKIGENVLDPGQTNYEDYTYYSVYDINPENLRKKSAIAIMPGNGWYNQNVVWGKNMIYGQPVFIAQLVIRYKNGTKIAYGTNTDWQWKNGPITFSNIYAGETYDANREAEDLFNSEKMTSGWMNARLTENHPTQLLEQFAEPIKRMDTVKVKKIIPKGDNKYIFDFGQNFAGWVRLKIEGKKGQVITLKCVEELDANKEIDPRTTGFRATKVIQTQKYTCKGEGVEIWEPKFTYFGFRYVEAEGLTEPPSKDLLTGIVVYSSLPETGEFSCSEENINKLHKLARWTIISNIHSIPTDCPHREKCGWTGDAHSFISALLYNYDAQKFISKYLFDMRSSARNTKKELYFGNNFHDRSIIDKPKGIPTMIVPGKRTSGTASPDWGTAMTQLPWNLYLHYGDSLILNHFYPDMKVWTDYISAKNEDGIIPHGLGDWCPPGGNINIDCPVPVSSSAFHIVDLKIMAEAAKITGRQNDYIMYSQVLNKSIADFNRHFFDTIAFTYGSQTADAMALDIGIVPEGARMNVAASIVKNIHSKYNGFLNTGIFGLSRIFKVLAENGFEDEVYRLLVKKGENSFAFMWEHYDATTLWEVLPVRTYENEDMYFRSHSHPMQAGFDSWFYSGIAGINPSQDAPGFRKISFKPYLTKHLSHAEADYISAFGKISSSWKKEGDKLTWDIEIPENTKGEVMLPCYGQKFSASVNGKPMNIKPTESDFAFLGELGSGKYHIELTTF